MSGLWDGHGAETRPRSPEQADGRRTPLGRDVKRVLIFIGSLTAGGAERVVATLSGFLVERGYPVTVVTMHTRDRDFYKLDERVDRICLDLAAGHKGIAKIFATIRRVRALRSVIRATETEVVIGMMSSSAVLAIFATVGLTTRVIVSERNYPGLKSADTPWRILRSLSYRFANAHVAQTRKGADWLARHTGSRDIHVIPNSVKWPVPACAPEITPASILDPEARVVLAVGSKVSQKGFDLLTTAFATAAKEDRNWHLVILGSPPSGGEIETEWRRLRGTVADAGLSDRVHFPGRAGNVTDWYVRADIFVLSSRYEGFPNALLEAMAGGCASIAFDCDTGPRDIIRHGSNGLLVPAADVSMLADALAALIVDPDLRRRLAEDAVGVRRSFAEERILGRWERVIDSAGPEPV